MNTKPLNMSWFDPNESYKEWAERKGLSLATFVNIPCARCGEYVEFQFTDEHSEDKTFKANNVPINVAKNVEGMSCWCGYCGTMNTAYLDISEEGFTLFAIED